jgi:hypothetical protein
MDDPYAVHPLDRLWQAITIPAGEDIDFIAEIRQVLGDLANIHVLSTAIDTSQNCQGGCMFAN